jgi:hypothetical protein
MGDWKDIPLIMPPNESVDDVELDQGAATMVDVVPMVVEGKLDLWKRPGLTPWITLPTNAPIDGLFWSDRQRTLIGVSAGRVWKFTDRNGTHAELTGSSGLLSNAPVTFSRDATRVVMANGGPLVYTDFATLTTLADPDAPQACTHVEFMDNFILANSVGTQFIQFSLVNDLVNWDAIDFFSAESSPDNVVAMKVGFQEILGLGRESVEFFTNDGTTPFSRIVGSAQPYGTEAPYSLAQVGGTWIWLDQHRRLVTMNGRQVTPVSTPYDRVIQRMTSVDDAIGYTVSIDGLPIYVLNFPTARQTLAYNYETQQWHKWGYWDAAQGLYQRYRGLSYAYARSWNLHLIGDYANGIIYRSDRQTFTDAGNPIRSLLRTGNLSHGTGMRKRSEALRLRCKRGLGTVDLADPQIMMRSRVNGGPWGQERWKSLGKVGETNPYVTWRNNGVYRTCQREFIHTDNTDLVISGAQEQLTLLGN